MIRPTDRAVIEPRMVDLPRHMMKRAMRRARVHADAIRAMVGNGGQEEYWQAFDAELKIER